ncbi:MAG: hypothetical protein K6A76_01495 [Oribacterium sp.]|nr:hypothetical protein [Oribacterium sp.]
MEKKCRARKLVLGALAFMMTAFTVFTASAAGNNSVKIINIHDTDKVPIPDWELSIYEVARFDASTYSYSITDDFHEYIDLSFINEEKTANEISEKAGELESAISQKGITAQGTVKSDANGNASFENLEDGLYIICYSTNSKFDSSPSFIAVPDYDNNSAVTLEAKIEKKSTGGSTGGGGGSSPHGGGYDNDDDGQEPEPGSVLGEDRELEVPDVEGPEDKIVLGAKRTPQTGDNSRMMLYLSIAGFSASILFAWIIIYVKRNRS